MGRLDNIAKEKRNNTIRTLYSQGTSQREISKMMGINPSTVASVLYTSKEQVISLHSTSYETMEKAKPRPFRANLRVGQFVTLCDIVHKDAKVVKTNPTAFKVAGVYPHHVRFERPGSNGNVITVDYVWADLRHRLKMKGGRVAC